MRRLVLAGVAAMVLAASASGAPVTSWKGTARLPAAAEAVPVAITATGGQAKVTFGGGHPVYTRVAVRRTGTRLRFTLPGRPPMVFDLELSTRSAAGRVTQGSARGSVSLAPGALPDEAKVGLYRGDVGVLGVVSLVGFRWLIDYESGEIRQLYGQGATRDAVGAGLAQREPLAGSATYTSRGLSWREATFPRVPLRQLEVRFASGSTMLAGTLTLPPGRGPFPAAALVHGSGPVARTDEAIYAGFLASRGIATLAYDKRGIGWSGGTYTGARADETAIDVLARDAAAAARFLAAQPEIDRQRVGLLGSSQAGWIMPLAAVREPAVRWLIPIVGPTVTQGESDAWGAGIGQGAATSRTFAEVDAEVRAGGPSGFDPLPSIRRLQIPALWVWGANDRHVPTALCVERLAPLAGASGGRLAFVVLPGANHGLIQSPNGLNDEVRRSSTFAPALFARLADWLRERGLAG